MQCRWSSVDIIYFNAPSIDMLTNEKDRKASNDPRKHLIIGVFGEKADQLGIVILAKGDKICYKWIL